MRSTSCGNRCGMWLWVVGLGLVLPVFLDAIPCTLAQEVEPVLIDKFETFQSVQKQSEHRPVFEFLPRLTDKEQQITAVLDGQTEVAFEDIDLIAALDYLGEFHGIDIWVDHRINPEEVMVTLRPKKKISLKSCLNLMLEPRGFSFFVEDDVLKVTAREVAETRLITRTYPIGDLYDSAEEAEELTKTLECGLGLPRQEDATPPLVISKKSQAIVMRQSHEVHDHLLQLLRDLRAIPANGVSSERVLEIGFERDQNGQKLSDVPTVRFRGTSLPVAQIDSLLNRERRQIELQHGAAQVGVTVLQIRAERDVPYASLQRVIEQCKLSGFDKFRIRAGSESLEKND